jgi:hypothetical protein
MNSVRDMVLKLRIVKAKGELLELSLNIKTYKESMDIFNCPINDLNESKKPLTVLSYKKCESFSLPHSFSKY